MEIKIAEEKGQPTLGYGESLIKYFANADGDTYSLALYCGANKHGKKQEKLIRSGKLIVDTLEKLTALKTILGNNFRVAP